MSCQCPLCGAGIVGGGSGCASCPLAWNCDLLQCPRCGYQFPKGSRLLAWAKRLVGRRPVTAPGPATLDDVAPGTTCVVAQVDGDAALQVRLAHLGLGAGAEVRVDQRRPELVLQVGATRFAVERSIGQRVIVHAARAAEPPERRPLDGRRM
jgi:Fe2+ transport system protein FeoA